MDNPPRRSPQCPERLRDAERTKRKLMDAALEEFAAKGFSGARVGDIAAAAGVNKQLISYYFGGKEGLYRAMRDEWRDAEREKSVPDTSAEDLMRWYLSNSLGDPRTVRLALWQALSGDPDFEDQSDIDEEQEQMRRRQDSGEIASELDPACVQLALMGMVMAPVAFRNTARKLLGIDIDAEEFESRYGDALARILQRLAEHPTTEKGKQ
ncbi:MAG TPA: TetR family transcriptional regulator [Stackebrandtia sp.]|jgi:AcrR family transcriptional regulator|uniref:TetR/AcrR family transcriptional regulator n=1 Tax=Stackebrandtia sp. TaxID=2023065 RepID=UPI002D63F6F8|nr:TetR family transcriptional regulator [Stackebrandtia sp.]HZE38532.1 TetR family transcriptional regulator [Stackebrandtia sp.]